MTGEKVKVLRYRADKCVGCRKCEKACSKVHFKVEKGGDRSAIRIMKAKGDWWEKLPEAVRKGLQGASDGEAEGKYVMHVCDQRGLCIDVCPVAAITRKPTGAVWLDRKRCVGCLSCIGFCPIDAMRRWEGEIEPFKCISCGSCVRACPEEALYMEERDVEEIKEVVHHRMGP